MYPRAELYADGGPAVVHLTPRGAATRKRNCSSRTSAHAGVCDVRTWEELMGPEGRPEHLSQIFSYDSDDEDLEAQGDGKVYLLGEQRWASRTLMQ
jgi:hypothetical protein